MPTDYSSILRNISLGLDTGQRFRANKQLERQREQELEGGEYDLDGRRRTRRAKLPAAYGESETLPEYQTTLSDPFAVKLLSFFKNKIGARKRKQAIQPVGMPGEEFGPPSDLAQIAAGPPQDEQSYEYGADQGYADGGQVSDEDMSEDELNERRAARLQTALEQADRLERDSGQSRRAIAAADARAPAGGISPEEGQRIQRRQKSRTLEADFNEAVAPVVGPGAIPPEKLYNRGPTFQRGRPGGVRPSGIPASEEVGPPASEPGQSALPTAPAQGRAARQSALPGGGGASAQTVDFSQLDVDPKEVPDMKTDDWKRYRFELMEAARATGRPEKIAEVNQMVTQMQQQGFISYGQQGLALQQAGNTKGAMAAYRAAFQYFPNGNDVEFGLVRGRDGKPVIVGFGKDEKTGERVEGSEMVMDPQRVAGLIENFQNPAAFRAWTKDWRDFEEGKRRFDQQQSGQNQDRNLRERQFSEVQKPLAQAQADNLANRSEADILRAQRAGGGELSPRDLQGSERTFRERVGLLGVTDEAQADFLASIMSQIKRGSPNSPDNAIVDAVMKAQRDGTLQEKLSRLGIK